MQTNQTTNRDYAASGDFRDICKQAAGLVHPDDEQAAHDAAEAWRTKRQASKFRNGRGRVYAALYGPRASAA